MIGETLGHYRIDALLGSGGFGAVYRAHDEVLHRLVAIKILKKPDSKARARILREARAASALNHPGISVVHEVGEQDGVPFIVMEYVEGRPLTDLVPPGRGLDLEQVLDYGSQIADAIAFAHEHRVVHRDLKAANVMVTPSGRIKVLDFGLADAQVDAAVSVMTETAPGDVLQAGHVVAGTLHYMAPELLRGQSGDTRTDVWALGVVLHELLSGEQPFVGKTQYQLSSAILSSPPRELPATVPPSVRSVVARCLTRDPQRRYQQAREIHAAVDAIRAGGGSVVAPGGWPSRRALLVGTGTLALGAALVVAGQKLLVSPQSLRILAIVSDVPADADPALIDGITESVINRVARLQSSQLRVIALGSVTRYKGRPIDVDQVSQDLRATHVAILRITPRPDASLALSAALQDVSVHGHVWGEQYDTRLRSLMEVQDDIAARLAEGLRVSLTGAQRKELARLGTTDGEAHRLYMQGRYYWYRSFATSEGYDKSLSYYEQAIARDPRYALAYLGVADTIMFMAGDGLIPVSEALPRVRSALDRALALDPTLPESHYSRGMLAWFTQSDWKTVERELRAAAAVDSVPHYRRYYAHFLLISNRFDDALDQMRRTLDIDPLGVETITAYGQTFFWTRRVPIKPSRSCVERWSWTRTSVSPTRSWPMCMRRPSGTTSRSGNWRARPDWGETTPRQRTSRRGTPRTDSSPPCSAFIGISWKPRRRRLNSSGCRRCTSRI